MTGSGAGLSSPDDPLIGRMLGGFRVLEPLGAGGMGVVYLAERVADERRAALKVLAPALARDPGLRTRFEREARYANSIHHPHILEVLGAGEDEGDLYLATAYVPGGDLKAVLNREGVLAPKRAVRLIGQVGAALDAAHAVGLLHRDVKPGNVMIAEAGTSGERALLGDFGLGKNPGKDSRALTEAGMWVGTTHYTAPEEITAADRDHRVDVYSLGCVLYECLTNEPPFVRADDLAIMYAHIQDPPPRASERRGDVPAALDEVIERAMAKDPAARFGSAGELAAAAAEAVGLRSVGTLVVARDLELEVTSGPAAGLRLRLDAPLEIGRAAPGAGRLGGDEKLSRRHARMSRDARRRMIVEDLGSLNGTWVNGERIDAPVDLAPGDTVKVGDSLLVVRVAGAVSPPADGDGAGAGAGARVSVSLDIDLEARRVDVAVGDLPPVRLTERDGEWRPEA